jgi:hypothetical protein
MAAGIGIGAARPAAPIQRSDRDPQHAGRSAAQADLPTISVDITVHIFVRDTQAGDAQAFLQSA